MWAILTPWAPRRLKKDFRTLKFGRFFFSPIFVRLWQWPSSFFPGLAGHTRAADGLEQESLSGGCHEAGCGGPAALGGQANAQRAIPRHGNCLKCKLYTHGFQD